MSKTNINARYAREEYLAKLLHMSRVPFSGGTLEGGFDDQYDDLALGQAKSTRRNVITLRVTEHLLPLKRHAGTRKPFFVLDFASPTLATKDGTHDLELSEEIWCAVPVRDFIEMRKAWLEKFFPDH